MDPATRVGLADPAGRATVAAPGDMNQVAATAGTAAVMAPAVLASRAVPAVRVVRVGMILGDRVDPVGMIRVDLEGRRRAPNPVVLVGPERLAVRNPEARVDPECLVVPNPVVRAEPGSREATDLILARALLGRMPMRLHLTAARRLPMPAVPHLTLVDRRTAVNRRWDPTTRAVAACPEATRAGATQEAATRAAVIRRAEATRAAATRAAATRRAGATDGGAELSRRAD